MRLPTRACSLRRITAPWGQGSDVAQTYGQASGEGFIWRRAAAPVKYRNAPRGCCIWLQFWREMGLAIAASKAGGCEWGLERIQPYVFCSRGCGWAILRGADHDLDRQKPQKQAEVLLERAVSSSDGATTRSRAG